ncbi:unnamed protein product [Medioppia subpectinata]|uniref:Nuclear receptor domain-containing protein n=1 Tax=Medioppia subpectinata TaxID=1979941 RepID=A0A7R9PTD1_9ACAR|nr:unnamed protein product [Medioppia subpectinata]CAG2100009.1 unnamed protein product [Medioppia subpectinata]
MLRYNFDVITCDSCRVFFRRNINKNKIRKCRFDGNCIIDMKTRKRCTSCRMKKCIKMGMKRLMERDVKALLALIKYGCLEIVLLRYSIFYDNNTDYWTCARTLDTEKVCGFKLSAMRHEKRDLYCFYQDYFHKVNTVLNHNSIILDLLTAILLFDPNRPNLIHRDVVKAEQQLYIYLLQRYLHLKYDSKTQSKLSQLMNILMDLQNICNIEMKNAYELYLDSYGPILQEILFDVTTN